MCLPIDVGRLWPSDPGRPIRSATILRDGLRLLEQREAEDAARLQALREAAAVGIAALDGGAFAEFDEPADLIAHLNESTERALRGRTS